MNLRWMSNTCIKLILVLVMFLFIYACGSGSDNPDQSGGAAQDVQSQSERDGRRMRDGDYRDGHRDDDRDEHKDDDEPGDGTAGSANIIAAHNPSSSQYNDNCLQCHGDIPNAQSLNSGISNAHVAMLAFTPGNGNTQCEWCHRNVSTNLVQAASAPGPFQTDIRKHVDTQLCAICHGPVGPGKRFYQTGLTANGNPDGAQLYHHLCSACHRELANSEVDGESAEEIYEAIAEDEGGMGPLSVLNPQWVQSIAVALGGDPTLPPDMPAPGTGAALYQQYCSGCHGDLANSSVAGASATLIQTAITNDTGGMGQFSFLSAAQIQAIADALSGQTPPPGGGGGGGGGVDGAALYQQYCSGCHGDLANSSVAGVSANLIQTAITNDTGGMGQFNFLTATQIQAIADALSGGQTQPPPGGGGGGGGTGATDGAALYQQYCSSCHRALSNSQVSGRSANEIQGAIRADRGGMGSLGFLSSEQISAIAAALNQ